MTSSTTDLNSIKNLLIQHGYEAGINCNGYVIVQDPVHRIATARGGWLELAGYKQVIIRHYREAIVFLSARE